MLISLDEKSNETANAKQKLKPLKVDTKNRI